MICLKIWDVKLDFWFDCIDRGSFILVKNFVKVFIIVFDLILRKGIVLGNCVDVYMIVNRYWLFILVLGNGFI